MRTNQDYKNAALDRLRDNWSPAVLATIVITILCLACTGGQTVPQIFHHPDGVFRAQPNVRVVFAVGDEKTDGGQDAFFPVEFRNDTFYGPTNIPISHGSNGWESPAGYECVFGGGRMAFPDLSTINYGFRSWEISGAGQAMAAHTWRFKAMSA